MKILTITGTRPELIRLAVILKKLDAVCEHVHVYTNQNYDPNLSDIFLKDLGLKVDYIFNKTSSLGHFLGNGFEQMEKVLNNEKPEKVLVLGDTNSALLAILAAKRGIPVYHMEAGNRCYDNEVPEETNRRVIDACAYMNLPYNDSSKENLINEGFHKNRVFKVGNPIHEVLKYYEKEINNSDILAKIGFSSYLDQYTHEPFILMTFHRTENVDSPSVSQSVFDAVNELAKNTKVILSFHPRTKDRFEKHKILIHPNVQLLTPVGFFDFVRLEKAADVVITDSGTVPEEMYLMGKSCIILRNTTERQELMEMGAFVVAGTKTDDILRAVKYLKENPTAYKHTALDDYDRTDVSDNVIKILIGQTPQLLRKCTT